MDISDSRFASPDRPAVHQIQVHRCDPMGESIVWCLASSYGGCFTWWNPKHKPRGRSEYVAPDSSKDGLQWKGYVTSLLWQAADSQWVPIALELTEQLELDFRGRYARGQVWQVARTNRGGRTKHPVRGMLIEERDPSATPPEFDILPCLRNLYHTYDLKLCVPNPLAQRVELPAVKGDAPVMPGKSDERAAKPEDVVQFRAKLAQQGFLKTKVL